MRGRRVEEGCNAGGALERGGAKHGAHVGTEEVDVSFFSGYLLFFLIFRF